MHIFIIVTSLASLLFSLDTDPDPWNGYSVSTSESLDSFTFNPAGVAIDHGSETGYYFAPDENGEISNKSAFYMANKANGLGYSLKYNRGDKLFNATDVNITFAGQINRSMSFGANWSKESKSISTGLLYRPINYLSIGIVSSFDEELEDFQSGRLGVAVRPLLSDLLTVGADVLYTNQVDSYAPFLELSIGNGISIRSQFYTETFENFTFDDISFISSINLDFGKTGFYINKLNPNTAEHGVGMGYYERSHKKSNIFNKGKKNEKKYIRFKLDGLFIEESPGKNLFGFGPASLFGSEEKGKQLRDWLNEIEKFTNDESVAGLIIDLGSVRAGFSKKQEMHEALREFKASGKEIIVYAEHGITNTDYYLISMANEIHINNLTGVNLRGLAMEVTFYRQLLDTLNIIPEVFRVNIDGDSYKTAGDPFLEETATEEMKENYGELLRDIYSVFVSGISEGRSWSEEETKETINNGPYFISSELVEQGLVTSVMYGDEFEEYVKEFTACEEDQECQYSYTTVKWNDIDRSQEYVTEWLPKEKNNIALIYAVGSIMPGSSKKGPSGSTIMGDETIKKAIKSAREDEEIDAIILRIDSGGGSAFASDQMWREIELTTNNSDSTKNKPFIASMSSVAASGGYYIACQADKIIANETTITGSIGVIGLNFNTSKFWRQYGVNKEIVVKEGEHADFYTTSRLRSDYELEKIESSIDNIYMIFKSRILNGRDDLNDIDRLDDIAMGRVWGGSNAKKHLLIDEIGGIRDAISLAAKEAGIADTDNINIIEYPKKDLTEHLRTEFFLTTDILLNILPAEMKKEYTNILTMKEIAETGAATVLPYSIEIK